eukprot:762811-Hanusia_phi.AAC.1
MLPGAIRAGMLLTMVWVLMAVSCTGSPLYTEMTSREEWCPVFAEIYHCNEPYMREACYQCGGGGSTEVACDGCPEGQYREGCEGTSAGTCRQCTACSMGYVSQNCSGATAGFCIIACPSGKFSNDNTSCEVCPAGKYSVYPALSGCLDCAPTSFSIAGSSACTQCPSNARVETEGSDGHRCVCNVSFAEVVLPPETGCLCEPGSTIELAATCPQFSGPGENLIIDVVRADQHVTWKQCWAQGSAAVRMNTSYGPVLVGHCSNVSSSLTKNFTNLAQHSYAQIDLWMVVGVGFDFNSLLISNDGKAVVNISPNVIYNSTSMMMIHVNYNISHTGKELELKLETVVQASHPPVWGISTTKISLFDGKRFFHDDPNLNVAGWDCSPNCVVSKSLCRNGLIVLGGFGQLGRNSQLRKTFTRLAMHTEIRIVVDFLQIDFWNKDKVVISVDGEVVLHQELRMGQSEPFCGDQFSRYNQNLHRLEVTVNHTSSNVSVSIGTTLSLLPVEQSWALANFELYTQHRCDVLLESPVLVQGSRCLPCPAGTYKTYPGPQPCSRCPSDLTGWQPSDPLCRHTSRRATAADLAGLGASRDLGVQDPLTEAAADGETKQWNGGQPDIPREFFGVCRRDEEGVPRYVDRSCLSSELSTEQMRTSVYMSNGSPIPDPPDLDASLRAVRSASQ